MSSPCFPLYFVDMQQRGIALNNELIYFADFAGEIRIITVEGSITEPNEEEKMEQMVCNEVHRLKELDRYKKNCKEAFKHEANYDF